MGYFSDAIIFYRLSCTDLLKIKACVHYFLRNFYSSPNDRPSKTMKDCFYFIEKALFILEIFKFLHFNLPLFFFPVSRCSSAWSKINLKVYDDVINCLSMNLIIHFVWYLEKEKKVSHWNFGHWCMTSLIIPLPFVFLNLEKVERKRKNTKIWISQERIELFRRNKHFSQFLKGYHLVKQ